MTPMTDRPAPGPSSLERALLRLLMAGHSLEAAAKAIGLSHEDAGDVVRELQTRCGISHLPRLFAVAILRAWI